MERWTGVLHVPLSRGGPLFRIAASVILTPSKTLAVRMNASLAPVSSPQSLKLPDAGQVPRANAVLFTGDRVRGTGKPAIERLSDAAYLAGLLAGKLAAGEANAWVVDAACFAGPHAVYRELVPSVDTVGDPKRYDPSGLPAAAGVANILTQCIREIQNKIMRGSLKDSASNQEPTALLLPPCPPKTIVLGFSKGGVVVNQLVTELSCWASESTKNSVDVSQRSTVLLIHDLLVPHTASDVLSSISAFHYLDVGLNCAGAYITDHAVIKEIANFVSRTTDNLRFSLHGTPRQWSDPNRPWILTEKNAMLQLLQDEAKKYEGRLIVSEKKYFDVCSLVVSVQHVRIMTECEYVEGIRFVFIFSNFTIVSFLQWLEGFKRQSRAHCINTIASPPSSIIMGFSEGGVVVNQLNEELSYWDSKSSKGSVDVSQGGTALLTHSLLVPATASDVLSSISEFHYVDVSLNCAGAYITDHDVIKGVANYVCHTSNSLCFALHGTPRQWSDPNRPWIQAERDRMLQLLNEEAKRCKGRLLLAEKKYFDGRPRSLLMHFAILEVMDMG